MNNINHIAAVLLLLLSCRGNSDHHRLCEEDKQVLKNMLEKSWPSNNHEYLRKACVEHVSKIAELVGSGMSRKWYTVVEFISLGIVVVNILRLWYMHMNDCCHLERLFQSHLNLPPTVER